MIDLVKARAICEAASQGPWSSYPIHGGDYGEVFGPKTPGDRIVLSSQGDASFIAAARTLLPEALNEVERLTIERTDFMRLAVTGAAHVKELEEIAENWKASAVKQGSRVEQLEAEQVKDLADVERFRGMARTYMDERDYWKKECEASRACAWREIRKLEETARLTDAPPCGYCKTPLACHNKGCAHMANRAPR